MKKLELDVKGMHCKSCETIIKEELEELDFVKSAEASVEKEKVTVSFEGVEGAEDKIKAIIKQEGYEVV